MAFQAHLRAAHDKHFSSPGQSKGERRYKILFQGL
jgi:hypothetical protein